MKESDEHLQILERFKAQLSEHFDTVQIFVTSHRDNESFACSAGCGNWYARVGQVTEWIVRNDELLRANARNTN